MTRLFAEPINIMSEIVDTISYATRQNQDIVTQELISEVIKNLKTPKYLLYSGHDSTMAPVWDFLNATNFHWDTIPFASSLHIELLLN